jgi:hypothetical protein
MSVKIQDNFLPKEIFNSIKNTMIGVDFDWYYSNAITDEKLDRKEFQFVHMFYHCGKPRQSFVVIEPLIQKIMPFSLVRAKANLLTVTNEIVTYDFHKDFLRDNLTTAVFYINTCNGYTLFKDGTKVQSVENRLVSFDSGLEHTGTSCTDENIRVVINLNYFQ